MDIDAFELHKNTGGVNDLDWQKAAGYVEYGFIDTVVSADTVVVTRGVQDSVTPKKYVVRLLGLGGSILEESIQPQKNDRVLLLFLHAHNDEALLPPEDRKETGGVVLDRNAKSYTMFTGIGILAKMFDGRSAITRTYGKDADGAYAEERVNARVRKLFNKAFSVAFDAIQETDGATIPDGPIDVYFGPHSPLNTEHAAPINTTIGMDKLDNTVEFPAPVTVGIGSTSPVEITSKSTLELLFEMGMRFIGSTITIEGEKVTITGGEVEMVGTVTPATTGPFNCLGNCLFSGTPHAGSQVLET